MTYWEDRAKEIIDEESKSDYEIAQEIQRIVDEMNADIEERSIVSMQDMRLMKVSHL
ncbi:hypothetical protein [Staphylococcus phage IME1318_01]|nr:hypothetical protein [Staphylococcus phage IME1318_01]